MYINTSPLLFTTLLTVPSILALPHWPPTLHHRSTTTKSTPTFTPTLPTSTLPAPPSGLALKYIALGLGTQNYSCPSTTSTPPLAIGALATLYDATHLFSTTSSLGATALSILTCGLTCLADSLNSSLSLPRLGHHYFDAVGRPTFDLSLADSSAAGSGPLLSAKKSASGPAPSGACKGRNKAEAVDWLMLVDNEAGLSRDVSVVYRVETVGGKVVGVGCDGSGSATVGSDYAALYWFYG